MANQQSVSTAPIIQAIETVQSGETFGSYGSGIMKTGGRFYSKQINLNASATTQSVNAIQVQGKIHGIRLYASIKSATVLTNLTAASFDIFDGVTTIQLTAPTGVLSGFAANSFLIKNALNTSPFAALNAANCGLIEIANIDAQEFYVIAKNGSNTYIRFTYTTTDAPINVQLSVSCDFYGIDGGQLMSPP